jgi:hypothetical protein
LIDQVNFLIGMKYRHYQFRHHNAHPGLPRQSGTAMLTKEMI